MGKKVLITGATGMVGKAVMLECLEHDGIDEVLVLSRSLVGESDPKLKELLISNFKDYSGYKGLLKEYDAAYLCMGVSVAGKSEEKYTEITYEYTMALANILYELNPDMVITYVSGEGTDSSEQGKVMWARVKGKTENNLMRKGFKGAYMFRPGIIIPLKGIKSKTKLYQFFYDYFMWAIKLYRKIKPEAVITTTQLGQAMINVTFQGYDQDILQPKDIIDVSRVK
ncbi:NAD-dependent epimerase/dehydratase family protein [Reichenbachiella versicolor]|uniref:NAD-dependent epimerase/dehydratase family protein n=1 Tax=Reichenbachiella versicolor TaxID=1821036 RepID=UPI000D6E15BE|nr:NAD-dependent epimerase/dehydratase family protein [Reichenbachiella versicolor]